MKTTLLTQFQYFIAILGLCALALTQTVQAEDDRGRRQGVYVGAEFGVVNAKGLSSDLSGVNHPTVCDQLLRDNDPATDDRVVDLSDPACNVGGTPQILTSNSFDLGKELLGGISVGYVQERFRVELEYSHRVYDGSDSSLWRIPGSNTPLASKNNEVSEIDPPSERISNFDAHQLFVNAYYDFLNTSRWTPYLGAGFSWARTRFDYSTRFLRKTIAQGYPSDKPPAAAGTLSYWDTRVSETLFGYQLLGGLDYALSDDVSIGIKARWADFEDFSHTGVWDLIRSHEPVQADGLTPWGSTLEFDDVEYWAVSFVVKFTF
ncbi:MAG: outer membrane beta-barrel protein [Gammaproteobacteria bacterium]|nr:outer membrane beta-barrel protein [Gammaproteobacteria bacterium]